MRITIGPVVAILLSACASPPDPLLDELEPVVPATVLDAPGADGEGNRDPAQVARGKYLVELLGCGACHTDGALIGEPVPGRSLAGSRVGIAYSNPIENPDPAVVFPPNLTPDPKTGTGSLSDAQLKNAIRAGVGRHGSRLLPVMPSAAFAKLTAEDTDAIVAYLRSIPAVEHAVPANVPAGKKTRALYVHFGVYRSRRP